MTTTDRQTSTTRDTATSPVRCANQSQDVRDSTQLSSTQKNSTLNTVRPPTKATTCEEVIMLDE